MTIRKLFSFEAAHVLPHHTGKCAHLHGHSYRLEVSVAGQLKTEGSAQGMVMDFGDISAIVKRKVIEVLDHAYLNDLIANPTCEIILTWIAESLARELPELTELILWETATASAVVGKDEINQIKMRATNAAIG